MDEDWAWVHEISIGQTDTRSGTICPIKRRPASLRATVTSSPSPSPYRYKALVFDNTLHDRYTFLLILTTLYLAVPSITTLLIDLMSVVHHNMNTGRYAKHSSPSSPTADDHRWSEVVPPDTALTFAALWDPEEGLITFKDATLLSCRGTGMADKLSITTPKDAFDARSQILTVDVQNASFDGQSIFVPPSNLGFSQASTPRFLPSAARSSFGTGANVDNFLRTQVPQEVPIRQRETVFDPPATPKRDRLRIDSLLKAKPTPVLRALRSKFFSRSSLVTIEASERRPSIDSTATAETLNPSYGVYLNRPYSPSPPRTTNLAISTVAEKRVSAQCTLGHQSTRTFVDSGFEEPSCNPRPKKTMDTTTSVRIALEQHLDELEGMCGRTLDLDLDATRDPRELKSQFSWTTTSTSRYIDVADALLDDDASDMSYDSFSPSSSNGSPQRLLPPIRMHNEDNHSEWFSVQPGDAVLDPAYRPITPRKLQKKSSKTTLSPAETEPCNSFAYANEVLDPRPCAICHRCRQQIRDCITNSVHEGGHVSQRPHPGLSSPHYAPPIPRKPSKPLRSMSQPDVSRPARPEEVLSRSFYNHEQGHPSQPLPFVSTARHPVSHQRSRSASDSVGRPPFNGLSHARSHSHQGTMHSISSAMPGPSLPPAPNHKVRPKNKNVAPPTSFRPFTAGSYFPNEPACFSPCEKRPSTAKPTFSYSTTSPLPRSHSHSALPDKARLGRLRTNSLSSLSNVARGAISAMTAAPLRNILHPHPQPQMQVSKATACAIASRRDDVWVRVDIRPKRSATMDY